MPTWGQLHIRRIRLSHLRRRSHLKRRRWQAITPGERGEMSVVSDNAMIGNRLDACGYILYKAVYALAICLLLHCTSTVERWLGTIY